MPPERDRTHELRNIGLTRGEWPCRHGRCYKQTRAIFSIPPASAVFKFKPTKEIASAPSCFRHTCATTKPQGKRKKAGAGCWGEDEARHFFPPQSTSDGKKAPSRVDDSKATAGTVGRGGGRGEGVERRKERPHRGAAASKVSVVATKERA